MEIKKRWEDWIFSFYIKNSSWVLVDLNWYSYSIVIEWDKWVEIFRESWNINISSQELIKTIPANETALLKEWDYNIEYKIITPTLNTFITDKIKFKCTNTLHYN